MQSLGANAVYLGPIFESGGHGYDTADYFLIDRRLGSNEAFKNWSQEVHQHDFRLVLDGVFHHVGRDFWAFRDVLEHAQDSAYRDWFQLDFDRRSPCGDPFGYAGWNGHHDLVKLNLSNPDVKAHLFDAVRYWIETFEIDGLRLDAADVLDLEFQHELAHFCRTLRPDFWLLGEVIHGDYRQWVKGASLDSVTNYEVYKGLYSSHNDQNYFEIAYSLNRQFGEDGIYAGLSLYNFVDNHDVERIATRLTNPSHLYPLHVLLFTIPGIPSLYYGSEVGVAGIKMQGSDTSLRPPLDPSESTHWGTHADLLPVLQKIIAIRAASPALQHGTYQELHVAHEQFAFLRSSSQEQIVIVVNAANHAAEITVSLPNIERGQLHDLLNLEAHFQVQGGRTTIALDPCWARVLVLRV